MKRISVFLLTTLLLISFNSSVFALYDPNNPIELPKDGAAITMINESLMPVAKFLDVKEHPASDDIAFVEESGIMVGYPDNTFKPDRNVSRLELAIVLDRVFDFNFRAITFIKQPEVKDMFDDVRDNEWYSTPLLETTFFGVLNSNDRLFKPDNGPTRIEIAKAIQQSFKAQNLNVIMTLMFPVFEDTNNLSPEESSALSFVFNTSIMRGNENNTFGPNEAVTRAELAGILKRTMHTLSLAEPVEERIIE
ncbi:MAG: hypothetical protein JM58_15115 [Peptococcaceae bacterium BICA1-8]|nr:MAG: hypothetical protein JM58_15115 [Peptococcaceae bacterium BICA1-8]